MERNRRTGGWRMGLAMGLAIGLLGGAIGVAVASIPASNGTISSCYSTRTGALRVIDSPRQRCGSGERLLRWNQTGPSNIAALRGTPCTAGAGTAGTLAVTVSATDGMVTTQCRTVMSVAGTVTLDRIDFSSGPAGSPLIKECAPATSCAASYGLGTANANVRMFDTSAFGYTCPGGIAKRSIPLTAEIQHGECLDVVMTVNRAVAVTP